MHSVRSCRKNPSKSRSRRAANGPKCGAPESMAGVCSPRKSFPKVRVLSNTPASALPRPRVGAANWRAKSAPNGVGMVASTFSSSIPRSISMAACSGTRRATSITPASPIANRRSCAAESLREIQPGEELSYDYYYDYDHYHEHPCRCGAQTCAGYIVKAPVRWRVRHAASSASKRRKSTRQAA